MRYSFKNIFGSPTDVSVTQPLPVANAPLAPAKITVPGIGTGSAYATGQAFGTEFSLSVPVNCTIDNVIFLDYNNSGIRKDIVIFSKPFAQTADKSAFAPSTADLVNCLGVISVDLFYTFSANQVGMSQIPLSFVAPAGQIWCQIVTRGADNIAVAAIPDIIVVTE